MPRPMVLCLLLACAVCLSSCAEVLENGMPIKWAQAVSQVTDLPTQGNILTPDPWQYLSRMSLYRLMITATDPFMGSMGTNSTDSPMWGLSLQLGWMLTSGRLVDPTGATTCGLQTGDPMCISTQSWWGCVNYFVSALPFLSAVEQGFMGEGVQVQMQVPEGVTDYCTTYADCKTHYADAMSKWDVFFQGLKTAVDAPVTESEKKDALLGLYWEAQMASTYASAACDAKKSQYSSVEVAFSNSWRNSAEYVSAAHFHSNLEKSVMFLSPLPGRVLLANDSAPNIADLSPEENHTLSIFSWMDSINTRLDGTLVRLWKRAMCSVSTREKGRQMLEQLLLKPRSATATFLAIVTGMSMSC